MRNAIYDLALMIHLKTIVSRVGWMIRNFISRKANGVLKICETLIRLPIGYCTQACVKTWILECNIEIGRFTKCQKKKKVQLQG